MVFKSAEMVEANIPTSTVVGVVARESIESWVQTHFQNIPRPPRVDLHVAPVRPDPNNPASPELELATIAAYGIHKAKVPDGEVKPTVDTKRHSVGRVICWPVLECERKIIDQHFLTFRDAVSVLIQKRAQVGWVKHVEAISIPDEAPW